MAPTLSRAVPAFLKPARLFIANEWRAATGGKTFAHTDPCTEEVTADVAEGTAQDLDLAVDAATRCLKGPWSRLSGHERGNLLWKVGELILAHAEELAFLETLDMGKPISDLRAIDIPHLANTFKYFAGWASKLDGSVKSVAGELHCFTLREPVGVVACITPFNYPLVLSVHKFAPALACGNAVVHKPADKTPLGALKLADILKEAGLPPGAFNVVNGPGSVIGDAISTHPGIHKIAFTGSTKVGVGIIQKSAPTAKHVTMELGGKSPHIVFADADLDKATEYAYQGCYGNQGEICFAGSRLLVERPVYDEVLARLAERLKRVKIGDPLDPATEMGPLATKADYEHALKYVGVGKSDGARLVAGGGRHDIGTGKGYFMQPTLYADVTPKMKLAQEEVFGPLLAVMPFDGEDEAVGIANSTPFGLASGVQTRDFGKAIRVAKAIQAGLVWVNTYGTFDPAAPFGGYKMSGYGRELGAEALEAYTQTKTVWMDYARS